MNLEQVLEVSSIENEDVQRDYLLNNFVVPLLNEHPDATKTFSTDDSLQGGFHVKPKLTHVHNFAIMQMDDLEYEVYIRGHYVDTLALADGGVGKTDVGIAIDGVVSSDDREFDVGVYTSVDRKV